MGSDNASKKFKTLKEFYPYYLSEHKKRGTRILHFIGTSLFILSLCAAILCRNIWFGLAGIIFAYAFAWIGHFCIEKNRPATFQYPFLSLISDFKLYSQMWRGK